MRCFVNKTSPLALAATTVLKSVGADVSEGDAFAASNDGKTYRGLQAIVSSVGGNQYASPSIFGKDTAERIRVNQWVGVAADIAAGSMPVAEAELLLPMGTKFLAGTATASFADALVYAAVAPTATSSPKDYPKLSRWASSVAAAELVAPIAATVKAKAPAAAAAGGGKGSGADKPTFVKPTEEEIAARRAAKEKEKAEKERIKAEKAAAGGGAAGDAAKKEAPAAPVLAGTDLDLRIGHIIDITKHAKADRLYVETIDLGEESGPRTIVSGLVQYYQPEQLKGRNVVVVANMKPRPLVGIPSHGMVLCASVEVAADPPTTKLEIVTAPEGTKPGERVQIGGKLRPELPPVTKKMTDLLAALKTDGTGAVQWGSEALSIGSGPLTTSIPDAIVK